MTSFHIAGITFAFSFASVTMAILLSNLMIVVLYFLFKKEGILLRLGFPLLSVFFVLTTIRLILPFEIVSFSTNIYYPKFISWVVSQIIFKRFENASYSLWNIFELVWLLVVIVKLILLAISSLRFQKFMTTYGKPIEKSSVFQQSFDIILKEHPRARNLRLYTVPFINVPAIYGLFHPVILIPESLELNKQNAFYILRHEVSHYLHHDLLLKSGLNILCIIYWWNPICRLLQRQIDTLLEIRIDTQIAKTPTEKSIYLECLLNVAKSSIPDNIPKSAVGLCNSKPSVLVQRFKIVSDTTTRTLHKNIKWSLTILILLLYLTTFIFTLENTSMLPIPEPGIIVPTSENSYFIKNENEKYDLYLDGEYACTENSLQYYPKDIPIYNLREENTRND